MAGNPLKLYAGSPLELGRRAGLSEDALQLLTPSRTVEEAVRALTESKSYGTAVSLLAYGLPKREAVWWACMAARLVLPDAASPNDVPDALRAAEAWVFKGTEENRRGAMAAARKDGFSAPSSWAAAGAFWSGGSMAPPEAPVVPPGDDLTARAVAGAVTLAAVQTQPELAERKYADLIEMALDIAAHGDGRRVLNARKIQVK